MTHMTRSPSNNNFKSTDGATANAEMNRYGHKSPNFKGWGGHNLTIAMEDTGGSFAGFNGRHAGGFKPHLRKFYSPK